MSGTGAISLDAGSISLHAVARRHERSAEITLTAAIPPGAHIESHAPPDPFLIPTVVEVDGLEGVGVDYPEPVRKDLGEELGVPGVLLPVYEGKVRFAIRGEAVPGVDVIRGAVRYQPCVRGTCLPPRSTSWEAPLDDHGAVQ